MGAIILLIIFGTKYQGDNQNFGSNEWNEDVFNASQIWVAEMFGTGILLFTVYATIDNPQEGGGPLGVFPIAMSVLIAHLFLIPMDGCSINPTRSFGPYLVARWIGSEGNFVHQQYMFWLGPLCGAAFASIVYGKDYATTHFYC